MSNNHVGGVLFFIVYSVHYSLIASISRQKKKAEGTPEFSFLFIPVCLFNTFLIVQHPRDNADAQCLVGRVTSLREKGKGGRRQCPQSLVYARDCDPSKLRGTSKLCTPIGGLLQPWLPRRALNTTSRPLQRIPLCGWFPPVPTAHFNVRRWNKS